MGMNKEQEDMIFSFCCKSKNGKDLTATELRFCERMFRLYPDEYKKISEKARITTLPFGAIG